MKKIVKGLKQDVHYTPQWLAKVLVREVAGESPLLVADLAAGEGSLLSEAARQWPSATLLATDIDRWRMRKLSRAGWQVGVCDLLSAKSRNACRALKQAQGKISLLLLNPPFTCRGGTRYSVDTENGAIQASAAMAFLLTGLSYLAPTGKAVVILPAGALHNAKDRAAWKHIRSRFVVRAVSTWDKNTFAGCAASSTVVRLWRRTRAPRVPRLERRVRRIDTAEAVTVVRGTCPAYRAPEDGQGPTLVHSTDLRDKAVVLNGHKGFGDHRCVSGPAVLIPRVGRLTKQKIALFSATKKIMMSDCVIALRVADLTAARKLQSVLIDQFSTLSSQYVGTGAPHITLERLRSALLRVGLVTV